MVDVVPVLRRSESGRLQGFSRLQPPGAMKTTVGRYGGAQGVGAVVAIVVGWVFLLGSVLLPSYQSLFFVGVGFCSLGFLMEFLLRSPPMKAT